MPYSNNYNPNSPKLWYFNIVECKDNGDIDGEKAFNVVAKNKYEATQKVMAYLNKYGICNYVVSAATFIMEIDDMGFINENFIQ